MVKENALVMEATERLPDVRTTRMLCPVPAASLQDTTVSLIQHVEAHEDAPCLAEGEIARIFEFSCCNSTRYALLVLTNGNRPRRAIAVSNDQERLIDPSDCPEVTISEKLEPWPCTEMHVNNVSDIHDDCSHVDTPATLTEVTDQNPNLPPT
jgi:hypothetical protein